jgi:hypothetical protein
VDTDERLAKLEQRLDAIESLVADVRTKITAWTATPGARKLIKLFGVTVP